MKMKKILIFLLFTAFGFSQNPISAPSPKQNIGVNYDFKNFGIYNTTLFNANFRPLTTAQINAITTPKVGQIVYNTTTNTNWFYNGSTWGEMGAGGIGLTDLSANAPLSYNNTSGVFDISLATSTTSGFLSSANWNTFNSKIGGTGTTNFVPKFTSAGVLGNSQIFDNGTGVGINTILPTERLHVIGNTLNETGFITARNLSTTNQFRIDPMDGVGPKLKLGTTADPVAFWEMGAYNSQNNFDNKGRDFQIFGTGITGIILKQGTGNVGIGTTTPGAELQIMKNNAATSLFIGNNATGKTYGIIKTSADTNGFLDISSVRTSGSVWGDIVLNQSGGNVGIATTAPTSTLHLNGSFAITPKIITANYTVLPTDSKLIVQNGATIMSITLPNPTTCIGREISISRYTGSTGAITITDARGATASIQDSTTGNLGTTILLGAFTGNKTWMVRLTAVTVGATTSWVQTL